MARASGRGGARRPAPNPSAFRRAAEAALAEAKPSGDNGFKIELARRIVVRALTLAAAGTPERIPALPALSLRPRSRSVSPCLRSLNAELRPMSATARISASR